MSSALRFRIPLALALCGSLVASLTAGATTLTPTHADIGRFLPEPDATAGLSVGDPRGLALGQYALSLTLDDAVDPLSLQQDDGSRPVLVPDRFEGFFGGLVGLYGPFSLGLEVPVVFQSGSLSAMPSLTQPLANGALAHAAFGDLRIDPRLQVFSESESGVDLAVAGGLTAPTGSSGAMTSDGGFGGEAYLSVAKTLYGGRLLGDLGVRFRPSEKIIQLDVGNELLVRIAAVYPLAKVVHVPLDALAELDVGTLLSSPFGNARESPAEWRLGARYCVRHHLAVTAAFGGGLTEAYGTPFARFVAGIGYDPRACLAAGEGVAPAGKAGPANRAAALVDTDHDGIPDNLDECPTVPGVAEYHGCPPPPPPDSDGDGIFDKDDWCPNVPGPLAFHGCPSEAAMNASAKARAARAAPAHPGVAKRPAAGLLATVKPAPAPKAVVAPLPAARPPPSAGAPGDRDGDGVPDAVDRCPDVKGTAALFGCPPTDRDHDGVPDVLDNCPDQKGTAANHGCPTFQLVAIHAKSLDLREKIRFGARDAILKRGSKRLLDQVAAVLRAHPEIARVRVEGNTDNAGSAVALKRLSERQARAVKAYLVAHGVAAARLETVGYGGSRPVALNLTRMGREANQRVELRILGLAAAPPPSLALPLVEPLPVAPPAGAAAAPQPPATKKAGAPSQKAGPAAKTEPKPPTDLALPSLDDLPPLNP